jgi:Cu2+-exporting ATPase
MNLAPVTPTDSEGSAYKILLQKFIAAMVFTLPILIVVMVEMIYHNPMTNDLDVTMKNWGQFIFSLSVIFYSCWMFFQKAWISFRTMNLNIFVWFRSWRSIYFQHSRLAFPDVFPAQFKNADGSVFLYFEAIAKELNLSPFKAKCLPQDKMEEVKKTTGEGKIVAMASDVINEAPALAQADIGIVMVWAQERM